jgi:lipopolysaccharide transport system ATP-binding protein
MSNHKIRLNNISKSYRKYSSEWLRMATWFGIPFKPKSQADVLKNVSFQINQGDAVALVGQNGAGKSTLLKIITGTLQPSSGTLEVNGRISAILELGMGFNPELSGRENVYHAAGLMGFTHAEVDALLPDILDFSELKSYFEQPLRVYSSGMQMRLAFSVATAVRPDLLIVDEALSVGDSYFQHKSFDRIRQYREQGTTLLFVSHDPGAIKALCNHAILLENGRIINEGSPDTIMDFYNALIAEKENAKSTQVQQHGSGKLQTVSGTGEARVESIVLYSKTGQQKEFISVGEEVVLRVKVKVYADIPKLVFGLLIKDRLGQDIFGTNTYHTNQVYFDAKAGDSLEFAVSFAANLGTGTYSVTTALVSSDTHLEDNYEWKDLALIFNVGNTGKNYFIGCNWLPVAIEITKQ